MSNEIKNIDLSHLRNDAHFQFHTQAATIMADENYDKLNIRTMYLAYQAVINREDDALKKITKSEFTEKIQTADKTRDRIYSCVTTIIKALVKHYKDDVVDAAKRLKIVIDTYGNINQKSYNEQTSAVYNILQEFNGKYKSDVELVRITEMIAELGTSNKAVDALIKERMNESAVRNTDKMKVVRVETDNAYNAIRKRINAAVIIEGEENYASFIDKMNVLIGRYKNLMARTKGKKKDDPADDVGDADNDL